MNIELKCRNENQSLHLLSHQDQDSDCECITNLMGFFLGFAKRSPHRWGILSTYQCLATWERLYRGQNKGMV